MNINHSFSLQNQWIKSLPFRWYIFGSLYFISLCARFPPAHPKFILISKEPYCNQFLHHNVRNCSRLCHWLLPSCGISLRHIPHHFPELPNETEFQLPPVVTSFITQALSIYFYYDSVYSWNCLPNKPLAYESFSQNVLQGSQTKTLL